jgi:hypothetical protein
MMPTLPMIRVRPQTRLFLPGLRISRPRKGALAIWNATVIAGRQDIESSGFLQR